MLVVSQESRAHGSEMAVPHSAPGIQIEAGRVLPQDLPVLIPDDLFVRPVGPYGLEVTDKTRGLQGQHVRLVGYMARESDPAPDRFILTGYAVEIDSYQEAGAGDIPAEAVFVRPARATGEHLPFVPGPISVAGWLEFGPKEESDQLVSSFRLVMDDDSSEALQHAHPLIPVQSARRNKSY